MGGGQAGAPADDDHVPGHVPPGMACVTSRSRRGPARVGRPRSRNRSGLRPGSGPKGHPLVARNSAEEVGFPVGVYRSKAAHVSYSSAGLPSWT
jgi:hypothetical protein